MANLPLEVDDSTGVIAAPSDQDTFLINNPLIRRNANAGLVTANSTMGSSLTNQYYDISPSATEVTINLPSASAMVAGSTVMVKNITDKSVILSRHPSTSDTIDGLTSVRVPGWSIVSVIWRDTNIWRVRYYSEPEVGALRQIAGSATTRQGWLALSSTPVSRTTYAGLFAVLGTTYGSGDGSTTFGLPTMVGSGWLIKT